VQFAHYRAYVALAPAHVGYVGITFVSLSNVKSL
jgi:hypothetical protein